MTIRNWNGFHACTWKIYVYASRAPTIPPRKKKTTTTQRCWSIFAEEMKWRVNTAHFLSFHIPIHLAYESRVFYSYKLVVVGIVFSSSVFRLYMAVRIVCCYGVILRLTFLEARAFGPFEIQPRSTDNRVSQVFHIDSQTQSAIYTPEKTFSDSMWHHSPTIHW